MLSVVVYFPQAGSSDISVWSVDVGLPGEWLSRIPTFISSVYFRGI